MKSNKPLRLRERVTGALRVLAVAPAGGATLAGLRITLAERIASGEVVDESEADACKGYEACERSYGRTPYYPDTP